MEKLLDKLTSYNIFNNLLPGIIFVILLKEITKFDFLLDDLLLGAFLYYFVGSVISRVGSIIIEPALKKLSFVKFAEYKDFVTASKQDTKIEILSEVNNMYRTFCSLFLLLFIMKIFDLITSNNPFLKEWNIYILLLFLLILFLFSFRKQTNYISKRVNSNL